MQKLLLFTDLHLGHPGPPDPAECLLRALDHAARFHGDAAHAVMMGDLTHHGRESEYAALSRALETFSLPVTLMLGNHDRRDAFRAAFPDAPVSVEGHVQASVDTGALRLLTLDTLDGPPWVEGQDAGRLCAARLGWLESRLAEAPDRPVLVFAHHPPMATGIEGMDRIGLQDGAAPVLRAPAQSGIGQRRRARLVDPAERLETAPARPVGRAQPVFRPRPGAIRGGAGRCGRRGPAPGGGPRLSGADRHNGITRAPE